MEPPSLPFLIVYFHPFTIGHAISLLILLLLLLCSALMSGSEAAYFSLSPNDIHKLKKQNSHSSMRVLKLLQNTDYLLSTILVFNNLVNVSIVLLVNHITISLVDFSQAPVLGFIIQVIATTFILLLFGEIMPKFLAVHNALSFGKAMSQPMQVLISIAKPITFLLVKFSGRLNKRLQTGKLTDVSMEDLSEAIDITATPTIEDKKMLKAIVESTSTEVREIMSSRIDVTAIDVEISFDELCQTVVDCGYSRIPVYQDTFDNVKGVLYVKDLLPFIHKDFDFRWQTLIREPYFIPESKKINDLLGEFQQKKMHMAVVVDEYGGTSGIITLEDILEEIVGEILDESDLEEDESLYTKINDTTYLFEGKTLLNDFCKIMQVSGEFFDEAKGEAETLAGFILERKGNFPQKGESIQYKHFLFTIEAADHRRIQKIRVTTNL